MDERENPQIDLETRLLNKILAKLYLDLSSSSHSDDVRSHTKEVLDKIDEYFAIERPSVLDIQSSIEELIESDQDLGSEMRARIIEELVVFSQGEFGRDFEDEIRARIEELFNATLDDEEIELSGVERQRLLDFIVTDILGFGPLEPLLLDETVTEIMVDGPNKIYVERGGKLEDAPGHFRDDEHLMRYIYRILAPLGRQLDESSPFVDARLPDGVRVNVVIPPISLVGPVLTIRMFRQRLLTIEDLLGFGTWNEDTVEFLRACVRARLNIVVAGGTGAGKTTVLNLLAGMISSNERIITVENAGQLQLPEHLKYVVRLESRPPDAEGKGEVTVQDLFINALRMRPDRIIVSEVRSAEALDLFQAINTGHDGNLMTIHANGPRDVLVRLEMMSTMHDIALPLLTIRQMIASAIDLITYQERLRDGSRKILKVTEVADMEKDVIVLQDIFEFQQTGFEEGKITGHFTATGHIPRFLDRIKAAGIDLPMSLFTPQ
jgi:pilus assembly protein CpaF